MRRSCGQTQKLERLGCEMEYTLKIFFSNIKTYVRIES